MKAAVELFESSRTPRISIPSPATALFAAWIQGPGRRPRVRSAKIVPWCGVPMVASVATRSPEPSVVIA